MAFLSPLRYPGGKGKLFGFVSKLIELNGLSHCLYVEPFAGGGNLALNLLMKGIVSEIVINDIDLAIYAFWFSILNNTDDFITLIDKTDVNLEEWKRQRIICNTEKEDLLKLGFSAFFLNRTNRSGILKAGPIGGKHSNGKYPLDCRFNKPELIRRIKNIQTYKDRITVLNVDAKDLLGMEFEEAAFFNIDPPYYHKGAELYKNYFSPDDHRELAQHIRSLKHPWIVTYDNVKFIKDIYSFANIRTLQVQYTAQTKRMADELLIFPDFVNCIDP